MTSATHLQPDQLMEFWNDFDINKDGALNQAEFVRMSSKITQILECEERVVMMWRIFDRNGDGVLSGPEFRRMCHELELDATGKQAMVRSHYDPYSHH